MTALTVVKTNSTNIPTAQATFINGNTYNPLMQNLPVAEIIEHDTPVKPEDEIALREKRDAKLLAMKAARDAEKTKRQRQHNLNGRPHCSIRIIARNSDSSPVLWEELTIQHPEKQDAYSLLTILQEKERFFRMDANKVKALSIQYYGR